MQRFGKPPLADKTYTPRPGAYAILPHGASFLMTFQSRPSPEFQLPGGGVDAHENPIQALHREVLEETGWTISAPKRIGVYKKFVFMPEYDLWAEKICQIFVAKPVLQKHEPIEPDHTSVFLSYDDAIDVLANDGDKAYLRRYVEFLRG